MILIILNLYVAPMPPIKFGLNQHWEMSFEEFQDGCRWMLEWDEFICSEFPCLPNASHQVSAQSDTVQEQMLFQDFQDGHHGGHLENWNGMNLAILNLQVTPMPLTKFRLNPTYRSGANMV